MSLANLIKEHFLTDHAFLDTAPLIIAFIMCISFKCLRLSIFFGFSLLLKPKDSCWEVGLTNVGIWTPFT